jgi:ATP-dependent Clp protease ATP-binding subunit ClpA/ActR/RegA family two-component response regulator
VFAWEEEFVLRHYDSNAQQAWQVAKVLANEEKRSLSTSDLWWGCLAVIPEDARGNLDLPLTSEKKDHLEQLSNQQVEERVAVTPEVTQLDQKLKTLCREMGAPVATPWHLLLVLLDQPDEDLTHMWDDLQVDREALRQQVQKQIEQVKLPSRRTPLPRQARNILAQFTRNLTEAAAQGQLTPAFERESERAAIVRTLLRKHKRNVALVGPAGVGKTKLVEDLALRIFQEEVSQLAECEIIALSPTALRAGASVHGEMEKRFEALRRVLEDHGDRFILFIDELHVIVGTAVSSHTLDLANALKPLLTSGHLRCIGATTHQEFIEYIERDRALARRFQMVPVPEPPRPAMERILEAVRPQYEEHHGVHYPPETLKTVLDLADVYIPNRFYPDKALDLLDEAGAWLVMQARPAEEEEPPQVTPTTVRTVLSEILHLPLEELTSSAMPQLADKLKERVLGQDQALQRIQDTLIASGGRATVSRRPRASMVFVGPQGCGKTFTAQVLAEALCHSSQALLELDLDQTLRTYWRGGGADFLLGPRPPYVGWEQGGVLTNHVLAYPQSVILVRGITRAQADVQHLFAGILERGECEDGRGQRITFRGVVLLFAIESDQVVERHIGFLQSTQTVAAAPDPMRLRDELLDLGILPGLLRQVGEVVPFQPLSTDALREIGRRRLEAFRRELYERESKALDVEEAFLPRLITPETRTAAEAEQQVERLVILPVNALRSSPEWEEWNTVRLAWDEGVSVEPVLPRVLVVDDLPDFFDELKQSYPEYHWFYSQDAETGGQAIESHRPHLVLIDTCFSASDEQDVGGVAVLKALKERYPTQQIVLVTAQGVDFETTREAFNVGAYDYLWKPPQESVLRQLVTALASQEEQQRRLAVQEQLLREQWQRSVEEEDGGIRIVYH